MSTDDTDLFEIETPDENQLMALEGAVNVALELIDRVAKAEMDLSDLKQQLAEVREKIIPDLMNGAGVSQFKTTTGVKVSIRDVWMGSLPKDPEERSAAMSWLIDHGAEDIIKDHVAMDFGRGDYDFAAEVKAELAKLGVTYKSDETVHAQVLWAFARERMKNGEPVPFDLLGIRAFQQAKIETPKR